MKLFLPVISVIFLFISCQKDKTDVPAIPNSTQDLVISFGGDTLKTPFPTGLTEPSAAQLANISYTEDLDSSLISPFAKIQAPSKYQISGLPQPQFQKYNDCVAQALGYAVMSYAYTKLYKTPFTGSSSYMYNKLTKPNSSKIGWSGLNLVEGLAFLKVFGTCNATLMPLSAAPNDPVSTNADVDAEKQVIADFHGFKSFDVELLKSIISKNYPIVFGMKVDLGFQGLSAKSYDEIPLATEPHGIAYVYKRQFGDDEGVHCMLIVGYDDALQAFKVMSSWGSGWVKNPDKTIKENIFWGDGGFAWINYETLKKYLVEYGGKPYMYWMEPAYVKTQPATNISSTSVTSGGIVLTDGGAVTQVRGVCWSSANRRPVIESSTNNFTVDGGGLGTYTSSITGLKPGKKYYIRAFVRKGTGEYFYGGMDSVTTKSLLLMDDLGIATQSQNFQKDIARTFSFKNFDLSPAVGLNYGLVTIVGNSNNNVTISKTNTSTNFSLNLSHNLMGNADVTTNFDIFYDGSKVQTINATISNNDSTEYYKNLVLGTWSNTWLSDFKNTGVREFYEEDLIDVRPGGVAVWTQARYYTGLIQSMNTSVGWRLYRSGNIYIMEIGAQSGRITPALTYTSVGSSYTNVLTKK